MSEEEFERERRRQLRELAARKRAPKRLRAIPNNDPADIDGFTGPWTGYQGECVGPEAVNMAPKEEEISRYLVEKAKLAPKTLSGYIELGQERTTFQGRQERDYLGRTYMTANVPARTLQADELFCKAPKKLLHTWTEHTKGVNCIRFIPKTGHLLLSAGQDERIKLWDVNGEGRPCMRTFYGHNKPIREVNFSPDGGRFISCAFDKTWKMWDTETGKCPLYRDHGNIPFTGIFDPVGETLLIGGGDGRIIQVDPRSGEVACSYQGHRGPINSIIFIPSERNNIFVSSGDDKTVRVWELGIGTEPLKMIKAVGLPVLTGGALHPTEPFLAYQALQSPSLSIFSLQDYITARPRQFGGHKTLGFGCQVCFSPDGRFLCSGDGNGQVVIWNWKTGQIARRIDAHPQVSIGVQWNPQETSRLATCSWDGTIKYWE